MRDGMSIGAGEGVRVIRMMNGGASVERGG